MGENICKGCNQQGINLQNLLIKIASAAQNKQTTKHSNKKLAADLNIYFSKEHSDEQKAHKKMLNTANYQRNTNQNYNEVSPQTSWKGHHQKVYK